MTLWHGAAAFLAAFVAGMMNSVAGGGTMVAFPVLVWMGVDPLKANVTCTVALWPGSLGGMFGFRRDLKQSRNWMLLLTVPSIVGGLAGAILLLVTPSRVFTSLVPYLVLFATLLFAVGDPLARLFRKKTAPANAESDPKDLPIKVVIFQFLVAVYGGYFGAGIGILMLAALEFFGAGDIYRMHAIKNYLAMCINGVAAIYFVFAGSVVWNDATVMAAGAIAGGYGAAGIARKLGPVFARRIVIAIGLALTVSLLLKR